ncbi:MAG: type IV pilin N-terminal domain-containing protein, partial [Thermoplasmatota archaeon]
MGERRMHRQNKAITEIIGTMLLLGITISLFSVVYVSVFTVSPPNRAPLANIAANIVEDTDGDSVVVIRHLGGNPIPGNAEIVINKGGISQRVTVSSLLAENETEWKAGTTFRFDEGDISGVNIDLMIVDVDSNAIVMNHQLQNGSRNLRPSIITDPASGITTSSVDLGLQYDFKGFSGEVFFEYRKQGESWITNATLTGLSDSGSHSTTITGLDDDTSYEYRAGLNYTHNEKLTLYGS